MFAWEFFFLLVLYFVFLGTNCSLIALVFPVLWAAKVVPTTLDGSTGEALKFHNPHHLISTALSAPITQEIQKQSIHRFKDLPFQESIVFFSNTIFTTSTLCFCSKLIYYTSFQAYYFFITH